MKLLVVGTKFGSTYLKAAKQSKNWEIAGVVAKSEKSVREAGIKFQIPQEHRFTDLKAALETVDAEAVAITVPNNLHFEFANLVLEYKKHLILEKPITETWEEAVKLVQKLDEIPGCKAMVGQTLRGELPLRIASEHLKSGVIGKIEQVSFNCHWMWTGDEKKQWRFRLPNMYLDDIGIHQFDELRMLLNNRRCLRVMARTHLPPSYPHQIQATAAGIMEFEDGIFVNYFASMSTRGKNVGWFGDVKIFGDKGALFRNASGDPLIYKGKSQTGTILGKLKNKQVVKKLPLSEFSKIGYLLEDFHYAIKEDRAPVTDLHDNLHSFAILQAMKKSALERREIDIKKEFPF